MSVFRLGLAARNDDVPAGQAGCRMRANARAAQQLLRQAEPAALADDDRLVAHVTAGLFADAAVANADDTVGDRRGLGIVTDDHRRACLGADQLADRVVDELRALGIELAGRLIGGIATGAVLAVLVVALVTLTAAAGSVELPLLLGVDWPVVLLGLLLYFGIGALAVAIATHRAFRADVAGRFAEVGT